jgi:hypothetical protein
MNATRGWRCLFRLAIIQLGANVVQPGGVDAVRLPVHGTDQLFGAEFLKTLSVQSLSTSPSRV